MKKKIAAIALVVALAAIGIVGASLAYFTDSKTSTNTFTMGKVEIDLTETSTASEGVLAGVAYDANGKKAGETGYDATKIVGYAFDKVMPGLVYSKAPNLKNTGDQPAYVGFEIELPGNMMAPYTLCNYFGLDSSKDDDVVAMIEKVFVGFDKSKWDVSISMKGLLTDSTTAVLQFVYKANDGILASGADVDLFTQVKIPEKMKQGDFENFDLKITAYAAQTNGFSNARDAINEAGFNHN